MDPMKAEKNNERYIFADLLKILAFFGVFIYHFFADRSIHEPEISESLLYGNFSVSAVAVGVFFIISGFGLMLSSERKKPTLSEYYLSRMPRLLLPYLAVTVLCVLYSILNFKLSAAFAMTGLLLYFFKLRLPRTRKNKVLLLALLILYLLLMAAGIAYKGIFRGGLDCLITDQPWTYIFIPFGLSSYLKFQGMDCIDFGIGEWFLGVLVLMYMVFPLIRLLLKKWNHFFFIGCTLLYLVWVWLYPFDLVIFAGFSVKLYSFIFGAWLAMNFKRISKKLLLVSLPVLVFSFLPITLPVSAEYTITLDAVMVLLSFFSAEDLLRKLPKQIRTFITEVSILEYTMFLIHHTVINILGSAGHFLSLSLGFRTLFYFGGDLFITVIISLLLQPFIRYLIALPKKSKKR